MTDCCCALSSASAKKVGPSDDEAPPDGAFADDCPPPAQRARGEGRARQQSREIKKRRESKSKKGKQKPRRTWNEHGVPDQLVTPAPQAAQRLHLGWSSAGPALAMETGPALRLLQLLFSAERGVRPPVAPGSRRQPRCGPNAATAARAAAATSVAWPPRPRLPEGSAPSSCAGARWTLPASNDWRARAAGRQPRPRHIRAYEDGDRACG